MFVRKSRFKALEQDVKDLRSALEKEHSKQIDAEKEVTQAKAADEAREHIEKFGEFRIIPGLEEGKPAYALIHHTVREKDEYVFMGGWEKAGLKEEMLGSFPTHKEAKNAMKVLLEPEVRYDSEGELINVDG